MPYKSIYDIACTGRQDAVEYIDTVIQAMGWELWDDQYVTPDDGSGDHGYRIYRTAGEDDYFQIPMYARFLMDSTANEINVDMYYYWNNSTHTGLGNATGTDGDITTSESGFTLWVYGNKSFFSAITKISTIYYAFGVGFPRPSELKPRATLTSNASSGSSVVLSIDDVTGFEKYPYTQIIGANQEGRDELEIEDVGVGTITVASLPRNYDAGAVIGMAPSPFVVSRDLTSGFSLNQIGVAGTANTSVLMYVSQLGFVAYGDPDSRRCAYRITPFEFFEDTLSNDCPTALNIENLLGYLDPELDGIGNVTSNIGSTLDTVSIMEYVSSNSTGSNGSNTLNDTGESWTTNEWVGKVVIITSGIGAGQIRKILSNTATQLTVNKNWDTTPTTSDYVICDEGWRYFQLGLYLVFKEEPTD